MKSLTKAPMGWNSYDYYDTTVTEEDIRKNALYMSEHLKEYGWEYIVVDIQWYAKDAGTKRDKYQYIPYGDHQIDEYGRLIPDENRFPSARGGKGFGPLADYVHSLGLKFGIHIMRGIPREAAHRHLPVYGTDILASDIADPTSICPWNPDMYGLRKACDKAQAYYDSIVSMYADWGVDFIKCDDICNSSLYPGADFNGWEELEMLHNAIDKTNREIVLSLSPGPAQLDKAWTYNRYANMWRITDDFWDNWESLLNMFHRCELWQNYVTSGGYPDCDMLPVGMLGRGFGWERKTYFTEAEEKTMLTLWCIFGSPLMIGGELTMLDDETLRLLTNRNLLKLLQNEYKGKQEFRNDEMCVWSSFNKETKEMYVAIFNFKDTENEICFDLNDIGFVYEKEISKAKELWSDEFVNVKNNQLSVVLDVHGVQIFELG